jgi:hypothetical protein
MQPEPKQTPEINQNPQDMETPKSNTMKNKIVRKQKSNPNQHKHPIHHNVPKVPKVSQSTAKNPRVTTKPKHTQAKPTSTTMETQN